MDFRKYDDTYYIRLDKGDRLPESVLEVCRKENIESAVFTGIGGCSDADLQSFDPEKNAFDTESIHGMLEMASVTGNIICDEDGGLIHHTHAVFSLRDGESQRVVAGHLKSTTVLYTAEIELRPVTEGRIKKRFDPETGTGFWEFE